MRTDEATGDEASLQMTSAAIFLKNLTEIDVLGTTFIVNC